MSRLNRKINASQTVIEFLQSVTTAGMSFLKRGPIVLMLDLAITIWSGRDEPDLDCSIYTDSWSKTASVLRDDISPQHTIRFTLCSSGVSKEQDFENRLKEEAEEKKKMVEFKAQAPKVLDQAPFVPKASRKPLVEFQEFNLATNERAEVWEENEAKKAERNAE